MKRAALLAALMVGTVAAPAAAVPSLGARMSPVEVVWERTPFVRIQSLADVPVAVALEFVEGGAGWQLATESLQLAPEELAEVAITAAGNDPTVIRATVQAVEPPPGAEAVTFTMNARARRMTWLEANGWIWWLAVLLLGIAFAWSLRRRLAR